MTLRYRSFWWLLGAFWVGAVFILCLIPSPPIPLHFAFADKYEHMATYTLLMLWFGQLSRHWLVAAVLILMGVSIELLQGMGGIRMFEWADIAANTFGVVLGSLLLLTPLSRTLSSVEQRLLIRHDKND